MPAPAGTKRVKGVQIHRPFVYGSTATPLDPNTRDPTIPTEHTHRWTVFIRGLPSLTPNPNSNNSSTSGGGTDITYWLKKVQFKLHETYANSTRTIEAPAPFEVTETGWGEFEVQMKLFFVSEANEKSQPLWHALKLHPYGPDAERQRENRETVRSLCYEEVVFNEPVEAFFDVLTNPAPVGAGKGGKGGKGGAAAGVSGWGREERTAEIPFAPEEGNPYSLRMEAAEVERFRQAQREVERLVKKERGVLLERERRMEWLREEEGVEE